MRQGWAVVSKEDGKNKPPYWHASGYSGVVRLSKGKKAEPYQQWKLRIIDCWADEAVRLLNTYQPDVVVSEIVPVVGGGNFVAATQSQLAAAAITTVQAIAVDRGYKIVQIGATTIKKRVGGSKTATKVGVRNGVMKLIPYLADRKKMWTKIFEEPDAIATALTYLGCSVV